MGNGLQRLIKIFKLLITVNEVPMFIFHTYKILHLNLHEPTFICYHCKFYTRKSPAEEPIQKPSQPTFSFSIICITSMITPSAGDWPNPLTVMRLCARS